MLLQCKSIWESRTVYSWRGLDLEGMNRMTNNVRPFLEGWLNFNVEGDEENPSTPMSARTAILGVDLVHDTPEDWQRSGIVDIIATHTGPVHCIVLSWSAFSDLQRTRILSSHDYSLHRRAAWGLVLQVVAEESDPHDPW